MNKVDSRCDLHLYNEQGHGFFNYAKFEFYKKTVHETDSFLKSLAYLSEEPLVEIKIGISYSDLNLNGGPAKLSAKH